MNEQNNRNTHKHHNNINNIDNKHTNETDNNDNLSTSTFRKGGAVETGVGVVHKTLGRVIM